MSRQWTIALIAAIATAVIMVTGFAPPPDASVTPAMQVSGSQSHILLAQFNPCPNGKCKF